MVQEIGNMQILEHHDIKLRALEPTDLELLYRWENDSEIWEVSHTLAPFSLFVLKQYLETAHLDIFETKQLRLVIELKSTGTPVGLIDLFDFDPFHRRAGVGIMIHDREHRRLGYASDALATLCNYAFEILQLHQLYCNITDTNEASLNLFKKNGFEIVGVKKDWIKTRTGWEDEFLLQRINS
ncbi:MAG: GNAT family N-acetyltransferase [Marinifilaceae bacterium]